MCVRIFLDSVAPSRRTPSRCPATQGDTCVSTSFHYPQISANNGAVGSRPERIQLQVRNSLCAASEVCHVFNSALGLRKEERKEVVRLRGGLGRRVAKGKWFISPNLNPAQL